MEPFAPKKEQRIAAHRSPTRTQQMVFAARMLWKFNRRLFWQVSAGLFGVGFLFSFMLALLIGAWL